MSECVTLDLLSRRRPLWYGVFLCSFPIFFFFFLKPSGFKVLGSGAFGTALGYCAAQNGHEVVIISSLAETVEKINATRKHPSRLLDANYSLPVNVRASSDPAELKKADFILHTIPVQYSRQALKMYDDLIGSTPIISASKATWNGMATPL